MVDQQLLQYIISQEHAGFAEPQIRAALLQNGYLPADVDAAFRELTKGATMDPAVHEYVLQYARQGMTPVQVFAALTQQGYAASKVRKSVIEVYGQGTLPAQHHAIVFAFIALLVAGVGVYFLLPTLRGVDTPPDITGKVPNEVSLTAQIAQVIAITLEKGKDAGVRECDLRFTGENRDTCYSTVALTQPANSKVCDRISVDKTRDACLWNFVDVERDSVCKRVQLRDNIEACKSLAALQTPSPGA